MTSGIKPLVAGNWKMNGLRSSLSELQEMIKAHDDDLKSRIDMLVCLPATLLVNSGEIAVGSSVIIGGQDCHANSGGAHTGDISAEMIVDCGASAVIVGHSERRTDHYESDEIVSAKAQAGIRNGLMTIVCVGESGDQRKAGETLSVLERQLAGSVPQQWQNSKNDAELVIAYEPVWAIGTGLTPTAGDVEEAHKFLRDELVGHFGETGNTVRILYGGSVKPSNASELMSIANVDGALVGGASLKAADFLGICEAYRGIS